MFALLDDTFRNAWWNKLDVTPKYLLWACLSLLMLGVSIGYQVADIALRHRWTWLSILQVGNWTFINFALWRPVYRVIAKSRKI
jgi:hypothetical protein